MIRDGTGWSKKKKKEEEGKYIYVQMENVVTFCHKRVCTLCREYQRDTECLYLYLCYSILALLWHL